MVVLNPVYKRYRDIARLERNKRIAMMHSGLKSLKSFIELYLPNHFYIRPYSTVHEGLFDLFDSEGSNRREVVKAPRGSGKTTMICLAYPLWCLAYQKRQFILFINEDDRKAKANIRKIKNELENNPLLKDHFPHLSPKKGKLIRRLESYSANMIMFANDSIIMATGKDAALRGINELGKRPDVIIYDDPQGKKEAESASRRQKDKDNFDTEINYLGGVGQSLDIFLIGTMISFDCLIEYVGRKPGWNYHEYDGVMDESNKQTYWPIRYCYDVHCLTPLEIENYHRRGTVGFENIRIPFYGILYDEQDNPKIVGMYDENPDGFNQEIRGIVMEKGSMPLRKELWQYYPFTMEFVKKLPFRIGALDLSMGKSNGDYQAISVLGADKSNYYLLDASLTRIDLLRGDNDESLAKLCLAFIKQYNLHTFIIEDNGAQGLFINTLNRLITTNHINCRIRGYRSKENKIERISNNLGLIMQRGSLYLRQDWQRVYPDFMRQFEHFPKGEHDDAPDVTDIALLGIQKVRSR